MTSEGENSHVMAEVRFPVPKFHSLTNGSWGRRNESSDFQLTDSDEDFQIYPKEEEVNETINNLEPIESNGGGGGDQGCQLAELQEQLMVTVLEKQQLAEELKNVKEEQMKRIMQQLRVERDRNRQLSEELKSKRRRKFGQRKSDIEKEDHLYKSKSMTALNRSDSSVSLETMEEEDEDEEEEEDGAEQTNEQIDNQPLLMNEASVQNQNHSWIQNIQTWVESYIQDVKKDFSEVNNQVDSPDDPFGEPLNIPKLKRNLIRSGNALDPLTDFIKDTSYIFRWEKPVTTFVIFLIYMYSVYQGLIITFTLALLTFLFMYAYFRQREWNSNSELAGKIDAREVEMNVGVRDQIAIILQVSRRAQNLSGQICDVCEKLKNLILWKQPEITKQAVLMLGVGLGASLVFSASTLCSMAGYYMGIRLFVVEYIFFRFPRVQQKYDKFAQLYQDLMSDVELQKRMRDQAAIMKGKYPKMGSTLNLSASSTSVSRRSSVEVSPPPEVSPSPISSSSSSSSSSTFNDIFQLPNSEVPLALWHGGRKCTLVNKDKPITGTFRVGKMFLTNNYLCFERFKTPSPKNLIIPLSSVVRIDKAKLYNWLPGGGRALEIKVKGSGKRLIFFFQTQLFGTIANRDEAFDSIMDIGRRNGYGWAT